MKSVSHTYCIRLEDLRFEPGEVVDTDFVFLARDGDQDVLSLQNLHLLEPSSRDQRVDCNTNRLQLNTTDLFTPKYEK